MISVIIPTYNRGNIIKKSIESVLNQTYRNLELIIVDDNSNDDTEKIVKNIKDSRIKYIKYDKNIGANKARNIGIQNSIGKYIAFNDSDDEWLPNKLEIQINKLIETDSDFIFCSYNRYDGETVTVVPIKEVNSRTIYRDLLRENLISTQTILAKKECLLNERFDENLPRFQDWDLVIRIAKKYKIEFVNNPLVNVYLQNDSISKDSIKAKQALDIMMEKYIEDLSLDKKSISRWYRMCMQYSSNSKERTRYFFKSLRYDFINIRNIASYIKYSIK